jgi:hypothetical protein
MMAWFSRKNLQPTIDIQHINEMLEREKLAKEAGPEHLLNALVAAAKPPIETVGTCALCGRITTVYRLHKVWCTEIYDYSCVTFNTLPDYLGQWYCDRDYEIMYKDARRRKMNRITDGKLFLEIPEELLTSQERDEKWNQENEQRKKDLALRQQLVREQQRVLEKQKRDDRQQRMDAQRELDRQKRDDRNQFLDGLRVEKHDQSMRIADQREADRRIDRIDRNQCNETKQGFAVERHEAWREDRGERKVVEARRSEIMEANNKWNEYNRAHMLQDRAKREADLKKKIDEEMQRQREEDEKFSPKDFEW